MQQDSCASNIGGNLPQFRSIGVVAAGSNTDSGIVSPAETIRAAIDALSEKGLLIRAVSRFFETPCFPAGAGPDFVNCVFEVGFSGSCKDLLAHLHDVEAAFGRERKKRWGPRTLDLDLIAVGQKILPDPHVLASWMGLPLAQQAECAPPGLVLPHPRLQDRAFVLVPWADLSDQWVHPVLNLTVAQMLDALPRDDLAQVKPLVFQAEAT